MDSYDNDWLFLDDDLFVVWFDDDITIPQKTNSCDRFIPLPKITHSCDRFVPMNDGEDNSDAVSAV